MSKSQLKLKNEVVTVSSAGTAVRAKSSTHHTWNVVIQAKNSNTGLIYVGNDGADDISSTEGFQLAAGQSLNLNAELFFSSHVEYVDLSKIWIDADTSGSSVVVMYSVTNELL